MTTIEDLFGVVEKLDVQHEVEVALIDTAPDYVAAQRQQLIEGRRSDDKNIFRLSTGSDEYSESYSRVKGKKKPIDLYRTGAWSQGIFVDVRDLFIVIESTDSKREKLEAAYGEEILGLGQKAEADYMPKLEEKYFANVTQKLSK